MFVGHPRQRQKPCAQSACKSYTFHRFPFVPVFRCVRGLAINPRRTTEHAWPNSHLFLVPNAYHNILVNRGHYPSTCPASATSIQKTKAVLKVFRTRQNRRAAAQISVLCHATSARRISGLRRPVVSATTPDS